MNPLTLGPLWLHVLGLLAVEAALIVGLAWLGQQWIRQATWRRVLWQLALLSVFGLTLAELSGAGRALLTHRFALAGRPAAATEAQTPCVPAADAASHAPSGGATSPRAPQHAVSVARARSVQAGVPRFTQDARPLLPLPGGAGWGEGDSAWFRVPMPSLERVENSPEAERSLGGSARASAIPVSNDPARSRWAVWLFRAWMAGATVVLARLALAQLLLMTFRHRRVANVEPAVSDRLQTLARRLGLRRRVRVLASPRLIGPIAFGVLRPAVALPRDFIEHHTPDHQEAMLAHELAHLVARDPLWYLLADLLTAVLWWHPGAWWMRRELHRASEAAADEASLAVANGPCLLAECLVELGTRLAPPRPFGALGLGMAGFRSDLGRRVEDLLRLDHRKVRSPSRRRASALRAVGSLATITVLLGSTGWAAPRIWREGDPMKTMRQEWKRTLAAVTLLAAIGNPAPAAAGDAVPSQNMAPVAPAPPSAAAPVAPTPATPPTAAAVSTPAAPAPVAAPAAVTPPAPQPAPPAMSVRYGGSSSERYGTQMQAPDAGATAASEGPKQSTVNDEVLRRRYGLSTEGPAQPAPADNQERFARQVRERYGIHSGMIPLQAQDPAASKLSAQLERIRFDQIHFDSLPLSEVVKMLSEQARNQDPQGKGLNFLLAPTAATPAPATAVDPNTGLAIAVPPPEPVDPANIRVHFSLPLRNVSLKDVLDAVVRAADHPIEYSVESYAIVFSPRADVAAPALPSAPTPRLSVRTYRLGDANSFARGLKQTFGIELPAAGPVPEPANRSQQVQSALGALLRKLGINTEEPGKSIFYNEVTGILMVRATEDDLELVSAAVETLGGAARKASGFEVYYGLEPTPVPAPPAAETQTP